MHKKKNEIKNVIGVGGSVHYGAFVFCLNSPLYMVVRYSVALLKHFSRNGQTLIYSSFQVAAAARRRNDWMGGGCFYEPTGPT